MSIRYIDIHSHFNLPQFNADLSAAIKKMEDEGVATICVGTDLATSKRAIEIAKMSQHIWATIGQHPTDTDEDFDAAAFLELAKHDKVVAIGECGFDYFRTPKNDIISNDALGRTVFEKQKEIFLAQINIAQQVGKPLMIHARPTKGVDAQGLAYMDAYEDTLNILSNITEENNDDAAKPLRANFHFFVGDEKIAARALALGHTMSYDGPITFTDEYNATIRSLPLSAIMVETDAPFAAPEPYRTELKQTRADGKMIPARCEPWMVKEVVKAIAKIRNEDEETVREAVLQNAKQFFKILL